MAAALFLLLACELHLPEVLEIQHAKLGRGVRICRLVK
jgi:hypothetical protein